MIEMCSHVNPPDSNEQFIIKLGPDYNVQDTGAPGTGPGPGLRATGLETHGFKELGYLKGFNKNLFSVS